MTKENELKNMTQKNHVTLFNDAVTLFSGFINSYINFPPAFSRYTQDFILPTLISFNAFVRAETKKSPASSIEDNMEAYLNFAHLNADLLFRELNGCQDAWFHFLNNNSLFKQISETVKTEGVDEIFSAMDTLVDQFIHQIAIRSSALQCLAKDYPQAMQDIKDQFGLYSKGSQLEKAGETDRYILYQVLPTLSGITVKKTGKPILIIPPYVLGANILSFLPQDNKSYVHAFANQGIPTYIRIVKSMAENPAVQTVTAEEDTLDTRLFCEIIKKRHGKQVTLNGYCQGGFTCLCSLLTGQLDHVVDAFITCVSPIDGTRSERLYNFLQSLTSRYNDLHYGEKFLPNGNIVADGDLLAWVYKLSSIENESPLVNFLRDFTMFLKQQTTDIKINRTAAALNYWLNCDRTDIPMDIARKSFISYNTPISPEGILPVTLFDRPLNIKRIAEKKIPWLICYGEGDDLVSKESALAPLDYVDAEVTPFPKGHVAIATSWSHPKSACAIHTRFGNNKVRGPVRYQLDLDSDLDKKEKTARN